VKQKIKLDPFEKEIESHVDKFVPITGEKRRRIEAIIERSRKTKNINIRITEDDLAHLKQKAEEEGMPYQTLISSVLHKYITDRLVDEKEVLKSLQLFGKHQGAF
jgi:predicted DNA binding CopG/RHH family protein